MSIVFMCVKGVRPLDELHLTFCKLQDSSSFTLTSGDQNDANCPAELSDAADNNQDFLIRVPGKDACLGVGEFADGAPIWAWVRLSPYLTKLAN